MSWPVSTQLVALDDDGARGNPDLLVCAWPSSLRGGRPSGGDPDDQQVSTAALIATSTRTHGGPPMTLAAPRRIPSIAHRARLVFATGQPRPGTSRWCRNAVRALLNGGAREVVAQSDADALAVAEQGIEHDPFVFISRPAAAPRVTSQNPVMTAAVLVGIGRFDAEVATHGNEHGGVKALSVMTMASAAHRRITGGDRRLGLSRSFAYSVPGVGRRPAPT